MSQAIRPFLKWAGGKYRLVEAISKQLPQADHLVEPFVGAGAVFLNTAYKHYTLGDTNPKLIELYQTLQTHGQDFIDYCKTFFVRKNNQETRYYKLRQHFNACQDILERSAVFVYLNRHGYNGLCRFNLKGKYNVPFGRYKSPYFPELEMQAFYQKAQKAKFICADFTKVMCKAKQGSVIYCDPPYVPLSKSAHFTQYHHRFSQEQQLQLAQLANELSQRGVPVLLSNHDTPFTREAYNNATLTKLKVNRSISCRGQSRKKAHEILALFE